MCATHAYAQVLALAKRGLPACTELPLRIDGFPDSMLLHLAFAAARPADAAEAEELADWLFDRGEMPVLDGADTQVWAKGGVGAFGVFAAQGVRSRGCTFERALFPPYIQKVPDTIKRGQRPCAVNLEVSFCAIARTACATSVWRCCPEPPKSWHGRSIGVNMLGLACAGAGSGRAAAALRGGPARSVEQWCRRCGAVEQGAGQGGRAGHGCSRSKAERGASVCVCKWGDGVLPKTVWGKLLMRLGQCQLTQINWGSGGESQRAREVFVHSLHLPHVGTAGTVCSGAAAGAADPAALRVHCGQPASRTQAQVGAALCVWACGVSAGSSTRAN